MEELNYGGNTESQKEPIDIIKMDQVTLERELFPEGERQVAVSGKDTVMINKEKGYTYTLLEGGDSVFDSETFSITRGPEMPTVVLNKKTEGGKSSIDLYDGEVLIASGSVTYVPFEGEDTQLTTTQEGDLRLFDGSKNIYYDFVGAAGYINEAKVYQSENVAKGYIIKHDSKGIKVFQR